MAIAKRKNGVAILNKSSQSGYAFQSNTRFKFNDVDWDYAEFTWDTNLGTPSPTLEFVWVHNGSIQVNSLEVSWGDGNYETFDTASSAAPPQQYSYASNGNYTIRWNQFFESGNSYWRITDDNVKITDVTRWGWALRNPNWGTGFGTFNSYTGMTTVSAADAPGVAKSVAASGSTCTVVDIGLQNWATTPFTWKAPQAVCNNSAVFNQDLTGIVPDLSSCNGSFMYFAPNAYNPNVTAWAEALRTTSPQAAKNCLYQFAFQAGGWNNGDAYGVSGGGVGIGLDTWPVGGEKAEGNPTSLSTGKLIDSTASFITDGVVAGYRVYKVYARSFTTVASVDSETQLTLNDDIFSSLSDEYLVANEDQNYNIAYFSSGGNHAFNQYIGSWKISGKTSLIDFGGQSFNQDISSWDITFVTNMFRFGNASFNFGYASGVANTAATAWDDRVWQVTDWGAAWGNGFNSDIRGWTFGIPSNIPSGTNTTSTELKLIDSGATFVTDGVQSSNWRVTNMDTGKQAIVTSVDSETQLTLNTDIFLGTGENYEVFYAVRAPGSLAGITYDISNLDTRCFYTMAGIFGNGTRAITADCGNWNLRNVTSLTSLFSASGGDASSQVFTMRNWERGAIGDADYSTTRCNTSLQGFMYHAEPANNIPMDNIDTRNVTSFATWNANGRWYNTPSNFCMKSVTNLTNVWYSNPVQFRARSWENWWQHPLGCNVRTNATNVFPSMTGSLSVNIAETESTVTSSTTTGTGSDDTALIDSTATFITDGVIVSDMVRNVTTGKFAFVYSVDSETQITTSMDYFGTIGDSYEIVHGYNGQEAYNGFLKLTAPIYNTIQATGNPTTISSKRLIDSGASFLTTAAPGDEVKNTTTGLLCNVIRVVSDTELSLTANRFTDVVEGYSVERHAPNTVLASGTTTSTGTLFQLIDSGATFLTSVREGDVVENTTDNTYTYIESIDSDTQLTLANGIFVSGEGYSISGGFGWTVTNSTFYQVAGRTDYTGQSTSVIDSDASFTTTVQVGWVFKNFTLNLTGTITAIVSDTELTLDTAASGDNDAYAIDQPGIF